MLNIIPLNLFLLAVLVTFTAGIVKGTVGFAMPMIMISGLSTFLPPEIALAALIIPTLVTNGWQALRQGIFAAWQSIGNFRIYLWFGLIMLIISAQLVRILPQGWLFLIIGLPVSFFAMLQLIGWQIRKMERTFKKEAAIGSLAGFLGGISGVWGPPTVAYLTMLDTPKKEQMRVQGVIYGLGAVALMFAHVQSGVLHTATIPLSLAMIIPAIAGMFVGLAIQDRIDQAMFRKATLIVLLVAGLNLVRRGLMGLG